MEIDAGTVVLVVTIALSLFGAKHIQVKGKAKQLQKTVDLLVAATEDDKVTEEEYKGIVSSIKQLVSDSEG